MDPNFALPIPFSKECFANRHELCRSRCGCFCHPAGHNREETPMPPERLSCPMLGCESSFVDPGLLEAHVRDAHPTQVAAEPKPITEVEPAPPRQRRPAKFRCSVPGCGKTYTTQGYLEKHTTKVHTITLPEVERGEELTIEEGGVEPYALIVEVGPGVTVRLLCESPMAFSLACTAAENHGVPFTTTQP